MLITVKCGHCFRKTGDLFKEKSTLVKYSEITEFSIAACGRPIKQESLPLCSAMTFHNATKGKYRHCVCPLELALGKCWLNRWMKGKFLLERTAVLNSVSFRDMLQLSSSFNNLDFKLKYQYTQRKIKKELFGS